MADVMASEPNLFGDLQERPDPQMVRARFELDEGGWVEYSGVCLLPLDSVDLNEMLEVEVLSWDEGIMPDFSEEEWDDCSSTSVWVWPVVECKVLEP